MFDLSAIQQALTRFGMDGWLMTDFRGSNVLARRVLGISETVMTSRRFAYVIPREGQPRAISHRIEPEVLAHLPGERTVFLKWEEWEAALEAAVEGMTVLAMEYSPRNANPYLARTDAGTVELLRDTNPNLKIVPSGDLIQLFEATWTDRQWELHQQAAKITNEAFGIAWKFVTDRVRETGAVEESAVSDQIIAHLTGNGLDYDHPPIVAVNGNAGNPHYETGGGEVTTIREGDLLLIDLWGKVDDPDGVFSDLTRMGYLGETVPEKYAEPFAAIRDARDAAVNRVREAFAAGEDLHGWQVDDACRSVLEQRGYGDEFCHRTGHSIGREIHGNGANIDNLETREDRLILPRTCFSIEPGIYRPDMGVRTEIDVYVDETGTVHVTGGEEQTKIYPLLK